MKRTIEKKRLRLNSLTLATLALAAGGVITDTDSAFCSVGCPGGGDSHNNPPCDTAGNQTCYPQVCGGSWPQNGCSGSPGICPGSGEFC